MGIFFENVIARQSFPFNNHPLKATLLHYKHFRKAVALICFSEVRALSTLPFQGGVILRTFVPDLGNGTYAMLTAMVNLP